MSLMRILITGGTGFIGSHLTKELLEENMEVVLFDAFPDISLLGDDAGCVKVIKGDLFDLEGLRNLVSEIRPEVIVQNNIFVAFC